MPAEVIRHIESILCAAVEITDRQKQSEYLDQACGGDASLRQQLNQLVANHMRAGAFLERPDADFPALALQPTQEKAGGSVGRYKLLEQLGEGGMGVVYMAEQLEPIRRRVALKIIKPGLDSRQVVGRFEAERQALALMDHPSIARVLDGGETESGRPYFVMELVRGMPINEYCDQASCTLRQRLELIVAVCRAVHHAHQKGIIHRDLKPSNVLVTLHDGIPIPKVIDFGIAKATNQQLSAKTFFTAFAQIIGTPLYMSPEQAELSCLDVDTRCDVYSLGVLTYELLTGRAPFDSEVLQRAGLDEMRRIIREEEPLRPSLRVSTLSAQEVSTLTERRRIDQRRLGKALRGELDWIVMRALEKDRNRRYESASAMADDLERYLNDEPVVACPPSWAYRVAKFSRRHRVLLTTSSLIAIALVAGAALSTWQAMEAKRAWSFANQRLADETRQREKAQRNLRLALESVNDMYDELGTVWLADDVEASNTQIHFLKKAVRLYGDVAADPAGNQLTVAETAELYRRRALLQNKLLQFDEASASINTAIALLRRGVTASPDDRKQRLALANVQNVAGAFFGQHRNAEAAIENYRSAAAEYQVLAAAEPDAPQHQCMLARIKHNWALAYSMQGNRPEAEGLIRQALGIYESLGPVRLKELGEFENYQLSRTALSRFLVDGGKASEAEALARAALGECETRMRNLWDNRPLREVQRLALDALSHALLVQGRDKEAELVLQRKLAAQVEQLARKREPSAYIGDMLYEGVRSQVQPEAWDDWVTTTVLLASVQRRLGKVHLAELQLGNAAITANFVQALRQNELRYYVTLANTYAETALLLRERFPQEANQHAEVAAAIWRKAAIQFDAPSLQAFTSTLHYRDGDFAWFCATFPEFDMTT